MGDLRHAVGLVRSGDLTRRAATAWVLDGWRYQLPGLWKREWAATRTIEDHARLVVAWLNGAHRFLPGYAGPPAPETLLIRDALISINRGGLVTFGSQPGLRSAEVEQRAFLDAYGSPETVRGVARAAAAAGLWVDTDGAGPGVRTMPSDRVPVTFDTATAEAFTTAGLWLPRDDFPVWDPEAVRWHPESRSAWESAALIVVVDPVLGRNDMLWSVVVSALEGC